MSDCDELGGGCSLEMMDGYSLYVRSFRETLSDVALVVEDSDGLGFKVSGRGELHLSILIEKIKTTK